MGLFGRGIIGAEPHFLSPFPACDHLHLPTCVERASLHRHGRSWTKKRGFISSTASFRLDSWKCPVQCIFRGVELQGRRGSLRRTLGLRVNLARFGVSTKSRAAFAVSRLVLSSCFAGNPGGTNCSPKVRTFGEAFVTRE